jgi:Fe/S biogenesis protein NfuA
MADATPAVVAVTSSALEHVARFVAGAPGGDARVLWIQVTGTTGGEYTVALSLEARTRIRRGDVVQDVGPIEVVVAAASVEKLRGATIDWSDAQAPGGFVVLNPNRPPAPPPALPTLPTLPMSSPGAPPRAPAGSLDSEVARRVMDVLDREVNPSIAAHGGHAELAGVEGEIAYLRLGGGCQGCGMATVTLSQGIEVAITQAVPEIERVVDVTDHASGRNPYFEPAKK